MRAHHASMVVPAVLLIFGAVIGFLLASRATALSVPMAAALAAAGLAFGRKLGTSVTVVALGLLLVWSRQELRLEPPADLDLGRPLQLVGTVVGEWEQYEFGWRARVRAAHVRQGLKVTRWSATLGVSLGGAKPPEEGRRLRARGYLGRAEPLRNGRKRRPGPWTLRVKSTRFLEVENDRTTTDRLTRSLRRQIRNSINGLSGHSGPVMRALLLGQSSALDRMLRQQVRRLGLSHLFAVSGLHIALLAAIAFALSAPFPRTARTAFALGVVLLYTLVAGARPSTLRAASMACLAAGALWLGRPTLVLQLLAISVAAMVAASPDLVFDMGFRLTASATAGIVVLAPRLESQWSALPSPLARPLAATVSAQIGSAPWAWSEFGLLHLSSPALNLLAVPWLGTVLVTAFAWALASTLAPATAGAVLQPLLETLVRPLAWLELLPAHPILTWPLALGALESALAAASAGVALYRPAGAALRCLSAALLVLMVLGGSRTPPSNGRLTMIDVGQGDALLLESGNRAMLIDGGGWPRGDIAGRVLLPVLAARGIRSLDVVVATHGDIDHCQGVLDLLVYLPVREVVSAPLAKASRCLEALALGGRSRWRATSAGDSWQLGRWEVRTLHPALHSDLQGNDRSLVLQVEGFERRLLLTGDIEAAAEIRLLRRLGRDLRSEILKVAHHGSKTSSRSAFLRAVSPRLALVSAGSRNRYGHPSLEVLERLHGSGARVLRTDRDGMVEVLFYPDGQVRVSSRGPG